MIEQKTSNQRLTAMRGNIPVENLYTAGPMGDRFLRALKEKGDILGTHCDTCDVTYAPARLFCEQCFSELTETVKVASTGRLVSWSRVHIDLDGKRLDKPALVGLIHLDGADTVFLHKLDIPDDDLEIGMKVKAAFESRAKRTGSILDIRHFIMHS